MMHVAYADCGAVCARVRWAVHNTLGVRSVRAVPENEKIPVQALLVGLCRILTDKASAGRAAFNLYWIAVYHTRLHGQGQEER